MVYCGDASESEPDGDRPYLEDLVLALAIGTDADPVALLHELAESPVPSVGGQCSSDNQVPPLKRVTRFASIVDGVIASDPTGSPVHEPPASFALLALIASLGGVRQRLSGMPIAWDGLRDGVGWDGIDSFEAGSDGIASLLDAVGGFGQRLSSVIGHRGFRRKAPAATTPSFAQWVGKCALGSVLTSGDSVQTAPERFADTDDVDDPEHFQLLGHFARCLLRAACYLSDRGAADVRYLRAELFTAGAAGVQLVGLPSIELWLRRRPWSGSDGGGGGCGGARVGGGASALWMRLSAFELPSLRSSRHGLLWRLKRERGGVTRSGTRGVGIRQSRAATVGGGCPYDQSKTPIESLPTLLEAHWTRWQEREPGEVDDGVIS